MYTSVKVSDQRIASSRVGCVVSTFVCIGSRLSSTGMNSSHASHIPSALVACYLSVVFIAVGG